MKIVKQGFCFKMISFFDTIFPNKGLLFCWLVVVGFFFFFFFGGLIKKISGTGNRQQRTLSHVAGVVDTTSLISCIKDACSRHHRNKVTEAAVSHKANCDT